MNTKGLFLGIDIDEDYSQVCFYDNKDKSVQPVFSGNESPFFQNAVSLSAIWEDETSSVKKISSMLAALIASAKEQTGEEDLSSVAVCMHDYSSAKRDVFHRAFEGLGIGRDRYILLGEEETFAYYAFSSEPALYAQGVVLYDLKKDGLKAYFLRRVSFKGATILTQTEGSLTSASVVKAAKGEIPLSQAENEIRDFFKTTLEAEKVSSVYLTGQAFDTDELPESFPAVLGRGGHRIFAGLNLYVKGACVGALAKAFPMADPFRSAGIYKNVSIATDDALSGAGRLARCIMACRNRISSEISVIERKGDVIASRVILESGSNIDDSHISFECIPGDDGSICLEVTPVGQNLPDVHILVPKGAGDEATGLSRYIVSFDFPDEDTALVNVCRRGSDSFEETKIDLLGSGKPSLHDKKSGIIYCETPVANVPFIFKETGAELYSLEELVKYTYENVYLTSKDFAGDELFSFLEDQVDSKALSERLKNLSDTGGSLKDILLTMFREVGYHTSQEIAIIEPVIEGMATGKRALYKYARAESFIKNNCLSKAIKELEEIRELGSDPELPESFYAKALYNEGVCFAHCLMYERAAVCFEQSYSYDKNEKTKASALLARRLSGTEPEIMYMKGEWESAGVRAGELREKAIESIRAQERDAEEEIERLKEEYLRKYT